MRNIYTQSTTIPANLNGQTPPSEAALLAAGWRHEPEVPAVPDGYTRLAIRLVESDGRTGAWDVVDRLTADIAAEAEAAETLRKSTPLTFDQPIETPVIVLQSHDGGKGIAQAALNDGTVVTYTYHASPIPSPAELRARFEAARDAHLAKRAEYATRKASTEGKVKPNMNVNELRELVLALQAQVEALGARVK